MNLGDPFLIYGRCKQAGVPLENNEAWIHAIMAIMIKRDKPGVPRTKEVYDSGHESDWDETQVHQVIISQDVEALCADMSIVLAIQATILRNQ